MNISPPDPDTNRDKTRLRRAMARELDRVFRRHETANSHEPIRTTPLAPDLDVSGYLLNSPDEEARIAKRQQRVKVVSIGICAVLFAILVAPWPSGDESSAPVSQSSSLDQSSTFDSFVDPVDAEETELPRRLDRPVRKPRPQPIKQRSDVANKRATSGTAPSSQAPSSVATIPRQAPRASYAKSRREAVLMPLS